MSTIFLSLTIFLFISILYMSLPITFYCLRETSLDQSKNICYMRIEPLLQKLFTRTDFKGLLCEKLNIQEMENIDDIWKAFILARNKNYPEINPNDGFISLRKAVDYIDDKLATKGIIEKKVEEGVFRRNADKKIAISDLKLFKIILDVKDMFVKGGAILPTKGLKGEDVLAVIPKSINKLKRNEVDQKILATLMLLDNPFIQDFIKEYKELQK